MSLNKLKSHLSAFTNKLKKTNKSFWGGVQIKKQSKKSGVLKADLGQKAQSTSKSTKKTESPTKKIQCGAQVRYTVKF
jgi:hypothetical protein